MTTPIVPSISDEQLAEIERFLSFGGSMLKVKSDALRGLIARLRASEADAKRWRHFGGMLAARQELSMEEVNSTIDAAMERKS